MKTLTALFCLLSIVWTSLALAAAPQASTPFEKARDQVLETLRDNDILMFGEEHTNVLSRELLMPVLEKGFDEGLIDTFVTEYVSEEVEAAFQKYLNSSKATTNSAEEKKFFQAISNIGYLWLTDETNKNFFRLLRKLKLKHKDLISICGNDVRTTHELMPGEKELNLKLREKRFKYLPKDLIDAAQFRFKKSLEDMLNAKSIGYDRELYLALRTKQCLEGKRKVIVQMGQKHTWSVSHYASPEETGGIAWAPVSQFLNHLYPNLKITTLTMMTPVHGTAKTLFEMKDLLKGMDTELPPVLVKKQEIQQALLRGGIISGQYRGFNLQTWDQVILTDKFKQMTPK